MRNLLGAIVGLAILTACTPATISPTAQPPATVTPASTKPLATDTPVPAQGAGRGEQVDVVCGNSLADATAINAAIAASPVGAEIVIHGPCLLDATIKLIGDRSYRGQSRTGTVLKQADQTDLVALFASDTFVDNQDWTGTPVSVRHLTLDGNRENNPQAHTAGMALRSWMSVVEDVYIANMSGDGLLVTNQSADGTGLTTSQVNGRISDNMITNSGRHGIYVQDNQNAVTDWFLSDNWIGFSGADGIHMENAAGWFIERNHIYGVPGNAIYAQRLWGTSITDNLIEGFGDSAQAGTWYGIYGSVQGGATSSISNNRIYNIGPHQDGKLNTASTYTYLALTTNYETGMVSITGNAIRGAGMGDEIGLSFSATNNRQLIATLSGNLVENVRTARVTQGDVKLSAGN